MLDKVTRQCLQTTQPFWWERRAEAVSNRGPSAYQPNALPLGQTGSLAFCPQKPWFIRDRNPRRPPRLSHTSWTLSFPEIVDLFRHFYSYNVDSVLPFLLISCGIVICNRTVDLFRPFYPYNVDPVSPFLLVSCGIVICNQTVDLFRHFNPSMWTQFRHFHSSCDIP